MTAQEQADKVTTRDLKLLRTTAKIENEALRQSDLMFKELGIRVAAVDFGVRPDTQTKRLNDFKEEVSSIVDEHMNEMQSNHSEYMYDVIQLEHEQSQKDINTVIGVTALAILLTRTDAKKAVDKMIVEGTTVKEHWSRLKTTVKQRINDTLQLGVLNKQEGKSLANTITGSRGIVGIKELIKKQVKSLIRTGANKAINEARVLAYRIHPKIKGMMQVSVLDGRTSDICKAYAGKKWDTNKFPIGHKLPFGSGVPRHFQCRSSIVPIEDLSKELNGFSFDKYLKSKSKEFQDDVLGKGKADLWRKGKITMSQLLDQSGRPLTLEELRNQYE